MSGWAVYTQHRLSFSVAEVLLLNNWTRVQQILYHMLRVFLKSEKYVESKDSGAKSLNNYHIKTLMLWACELKPGRWWNDDFNVVEICVYLLHVLGVWLRDARCKHYFINNCNLLDHLDKCSAPLTASKLKCVTKESLSKWFVNNYIRKCVRRCFNKIPMFDQFFDFVIALGQLQEAVSFVVYYRGAVMLPFEVTHEVSSAHFRLLCIVSQYSLTPHSCSYLMSELAKIDHRLSVYLIAVAFLHVAYKTSKDSLTDELLSVLVTFCLQATQMPSSKAQMRMCKSLQSFVKCALRLGVHRHHTTPAASRYSSELVDILQQTAVKLLTILCQIEARDLREDVTIFTLQYEALYAYKHGDYQRCLQLSRYRPISLPSEPTLPVLEQPVLWQGVYALPEFIQLLDDSTASLIGLTVIVNLSYRGVRLPYPIGQQCMSLYLIAQCQMKLHHSVTALVKTLDNIEHELSFRGDRWHVLHELVLKLIERKVQQYIATNGRP